MLFALRSGMFSRDIIPSFIATFRAVVKANFSTEVVRALATFVTSFSQKRNQPAFPLIVGKSGRQTVSKGTSSPIKTTFISSDINDASKATRKTSAARESAGYEVVVLEMLVDVLLSPERRYINKFATTITSKVCSILTLLILVVSSPLVRFKL